LERAERADQTSRETRGEIAKLYAELYHAVIARSEATKQSIPQQQGKLDYFAEPVIGRAFARPVGSQ
jgi:hypothetical protein